MELDNAAFSQRIGKRIKALLKSRGLTVSAFADQHNIPRPNLSLKLNGSRGISAVELGYYADLLGLTIDELVHGKRPAEPPPEWPRIPLYGVYSDTCIDPFLAHLDGEPAAESTWSIPSLHADNPRSPAPRQIALYFPYGEADFVPEGIFMDYIRIFARYGRPLPLANGTVAIVRIPDQGSVLRTFYCDSYRYYVAPLNPALRDLRERIDLKQIRAVQTGLIQGDF